MPKRKVKSRASPRDLSFSSGWMLGSFLMRVSRNLGYTPQTLEAYPEITKFHICWWQEKSKMIKDSILSKLKERYPEIFEELLQESKPSDDIETVFGGVDLKWNHRGDILPEKWFGNSEDMVSDIKKEWFAVLNMMDGACKAIVAKYKASGKVGAGIKQQKRALAYSAIAGKVRRVSKDAKDEIIQE